VFLSTVVDNGCDTNTSLTEDEPANTMEPTTKGTAIITPTPRTKLQPVIRIRKLGTVVCHLTFSLMIGDMLPNAIAPARAGGLADSASQERRFREVPLESRRLLGPLFWLHGDESRQQLESELEKVAAGGNGCFTAESRPHPDWLGEGWFRDLQICLDAAKKHNLLMWIFDEKWFPSQGVGGKVPPRYAAKRMAASAVEVEGPRAWEAEGCGGDRYIATVAGRLTTAGKVEGGSLIDLAPHVHDAKLHWQVPAGRWKVMKFTHVQAPPLGNGQLSVDGASKDCVDWFLQTVYQPHYGRFKADFGKTIRGFFYDEPETRGDWGTELGRVLAERKVDWKKAYVAYAFELAGKEQTAARYQYLDAFAETWGRTMYGGMSAWCHERGVESIGHFMEHGHWAEKSGLYFHRDYCAGDMMRLQKYSDMGGIDAVAKQFAMGQRVGEDNPVWQTPKLGSSISHVFGKPNDVAMVEIFGARGQDLTYSEMKWWTDHMQVSGVNFLIPHSFNPRAPYDNEAPPFFYNGGFEPRWPLYRVFADYNSRLSLMLTGGRHVCPVAILFSGNLGQVGKMVTPEAMTDAIQDSQYDCDWLPMEVFEGKTSLHQKEIQLNEERYRVLIVPPVEVIPYATLAKAKAFFERGGVLVGYGFLPSKSATIGKNGADVLALCREIWGDNVQPGTTACKTNGAGGRSYLLAANPGREELAAALAGDANVHPALEVFEGKTDGWLHVLHRVKDGRDLFFVANQNHLGAARTFKFRATAHGEPEVWDAMRNEITALPFQRIAPNQVEFSLTLEPLETQLIVFHASRVARPMRSEAGVRPVREPVVLVRDPNPTATPLTPEPKPGRPLTLSPVKAADPFRSRVTIPADVNLEKVRVYLEMDGLPDNSAAVTVNGTKAGGVIGKPTRLEITRQLKAGENTIEIAPLAPQAATLAFTHIR